MTNNNSKSGFFNWWGKTVVRFRWTILVLWLVALGLVMALAPKLADVTTSDANGILPDQAISVQALAAAKKYFPTQAAPSQAVVLLVSSGASLADARLTDFVADYTNWLKTSFDPKLVTQILSPADPSLKAGLTSPDQKSEMIYIGLQAGPDDPRVYSILTQLREKLKQAPTGYTSYLTGGAAILSDYTHQATSSVDSTTSITIVLVVIILLLIFRSPVTPIVPLATIGVSYLITIGIVAWLTHFGLTVVSFTQAFLVVVLFGVGTDYCLFIVSRFREFVAAGDAPHQAASKGIARVGETITSSAGTVVVGMLVMATAKMKLFSTSGPDIAVGVVITLLCALTFTPALLSILGKKAFWLSSIHPKAEGSRIWVAMANFVARHKWLPLILAGILLFPLAVLGTTAKQTFDMTADLSDKVLSKQGFNVMSSHFGAGEMQPLDLIITHFGDYQSVVGLTQIQQLTDRVRQIDGIASVRSLTSPDGSQDSAASDLMQVTGQLKMIQTMLPGNNSSATQTAATAARATDLDTLGQYFNSVQSQFTDIDDTLFQAVQADFHNLETSMASCGQPIFVGDQLRYMASLIGVANVDVASKNAALSGTAQLKTLQDYVTGLGNSLPTLQQTNAFSALQQQVQLLALAATLTTNSQTLTPSQPSNAASLQTGLISKINQLATKADQIAPHVIFIPSGQSTDLSALASLPQVQQSLQALTQSIAKLEQAFGQRAPAYFLPLALAGDNAAFATMLKTYTSATDQAIRLQIVLRDDPYSDAAMATSNRLLQQFKPGSNVYLSGTSPNMLDIKNTLHADTIQMIALVLIGIAIVLMLLLRSIVAPIYLLATILLSYLSTLGVCQLVFGTWLHKDLTWWVPFFMFVLLVALGVDYNIFLIGRVKEETKSHGTVDGIRLALQHTGGIITSAGIILAGTFAAMMSGSILGLVEIGFAVTVGVLLDTFVIRTTVVPAIALMLDKWNWWPSHAPKD